VINIVTTQYNITCSSERALRGLLTVPGAYMAGVALRCKRMSSAITLYTIADTYILDDDATLRSSTIHATYIFTIHAYYTACIVIVNLQ
jgi:hypothetical protein